MLKIASITTTTDKQYEDLLYDGTIQDLNNEFRDYTVTMLEFLYKRSDGEYATMYLTRGVIESIFLAEREVCMEETTTEDGKKAYKQASKKKAGGGAKVKFSMPPSLDMDKLAELYSKTCKEEVFCDFKEEIDAISETGYDRLVDDIVDSVITVFPPHIDENIDRIAYFLSAPYIMYIGALLDENPDIFKEENDDKLAEAVYEFAAQNKGFEIIRDEEDIDGTD